MLGPNDIEDWYDDADRLRAEILALPIAVAFRAGGQDRAAALDAELVARFRRFERGPNMAIEQLRALLSDLKRAEARRRP